MYKNAGEVRLQIVPHAFERLAAAPFQQAAAASLSVDRQTIGCTQIVTSADASSSCLNLHAHCLATLLIPTGVS
jgi:hypothetical protein